jgi:hypothetical protein
LPLRELTANALYNKGCTFAALGRRIEAIAVWDGLLDRFGTASEMPLCNLIDEATHPLFLHLVGRRGGPFNTGGA